MELYRRIISGEAGPWAAPLRAGLWAASCIYRLVVDLRNQRYDSIPDRIRRLPVPVLSVGNITAGGTGKTPLVIELARRLQQRSRQPAVVSRGYKSQANQAADELLLVRRRAGDLITVADPDRVAGGLKAVEQGADVIVLDDAFQHRRIHRDLDIVVIDATCPFGYHHLLPRGLLREPLAGLARADLIVLSRTDAVSAERIEAIASIIRRYNTEAPILHSRHHPTHLSALDGARMELAMLQARQVVCVSGIGNPQAFVRTVELLGAVPLASLHLPDHARYDAGVWNSLARMVQRFPHAECLVTTEKDLVKLDSERWKSFPLPIVAVVIDINLTGSSDTILQTAVDRLICPRQE